MMKGYDVIIVGGGIMGCSSAFHLAQRGIKVAVFDKQMIGEGPTGKSSAIIRQHYSNELTARMALYSLGIFQNFEEHIGGECGFTRCGFIVLVENKDRAGLEANVALQHEVGIRTELLSAQDLKTLIPGAAVDDLMAIAYEPDSGYADPYLTVTSMAAAARRHGVDIFQESEVTAVRFRGERVVGVDTAEERYHAPVVINCAGAWGARVAKMAGLQVPINSCRVQVSFFKRPEGHEFPHPVVGDFINATYFRSETGGLTLVGLIDPEEADAVVDPDHFRQYVDTEFVLDSGERLIRRYPPMEQSHSAGGYASLYAITPDWHPIVDEALPGSGFYICSGFSGHGFKLGPAIGLMVADLITGIRNPTFDPYLFRLSRFQEDDLVKGQYEYSIVG